MGGRRLVEVTGGVGGGAFFKRQTVGDMFQELYEKRPREAEALRQLLLFALKRIDREEGTGQKRMAFVVPAFLRRFSHR